MYQTQISIQVSFTFNNVLEHTAAKVIQQTKTQTNKAKNDLLVSYSNTKKQSVLCQVSSVQCRKSNNYVHNQFKQLKFNQLNLKSC